ncbi:MAG: metallophosphoesterase [Pseudomonadota bacterium]
MVSFGTARLPAGLRLYAIGDIHGELAMLEDRHAAIEADLLRRPVADWRVVHLGDLIDRGPDSLGVMQFLAALDPSRHLTLCGNHDGYLRFFLDNPEGAPFEQWQRNGGDAALISFGLDRSLILRGERRDIHAALEAALPPTLRAFLDGLPNKLRFGDFGFTHAGIRPDVPWERQTQDDLHWIRWDFLNHEAPHEVVVVHGHTPAPQIELKTNRVNVDTGAGKGGALSCIVIEGTEVAALGDDGPVALSTG